MPLASAAGIINCTFSSMLSAEHQIILILDKFLTVPDESKPLY